MYTKKAHNSNLYTSSKDETCDTKHLPENYSIIIYYLETSQISTDLGMFQIFNLCFDNVIVLSPDSLDCLHIKFNSLIFIIISIVMVKQC